MKFKKILILSFLALILSACDGSPSGHFQPLPDGDYNVYESYMASQNAEPKILATMSITSLTGKYTGNPENPDSWHFPQGSVDFQIYTPDKGVTWIFFTNSEFCFSYYVIFNERHKISKRQDSGWEFQGHRDYVRFYIDLRKD